MIPFSNWWGWNGADISQIVCVPFPDSISFPALFSNECSNVRAAHFPHVLIYSHYYIQMYPLTMHSTASYALKFYIYNDILLYTILCRLLSSFKMMLLSFIHIAVCNFHLFIFNCYLGFHYMGIPPLTHSCPADSTNKEWCHLLV